jgi:hypothetical protein
MNKNLLFLTFFASLAMASCKKDSTIAPVAAPELTANIVVPEDFKWENSRNLNVILGIYDAKYQNSIHLVSIYDANPANGGKMLTKGAATSIAPFRTKLYLSNLINEVFVVSTAPDNSQMTKVVAVGISDIDAVIGQ